MKTIVAVLLASCVVSLAQTTADNSALDTTKQLLNAAMSNNVETVKLLLNNGVDVNSTNNQGDTALMLAVAKGQTNMVEFLLDKGADINAKDNDGDTALMNAGSVLIDPATGLPEMFTVDNEINETKIDKLLLDKGADINAKDKNGDTALMLAATQGQINKVGFLLDKGADINAKDKNGNTALMNAVWGRKTNVVKLLLDKGVDINAKNNDGDTVLMNADTSSVQIDLATGLPEIFALDDEVDEIKIDKLLLASGADINAVNTHGQTALELAIKSGKMAIVQLLQPVNSVVASGTNTDSSGYVTNEALLTPFTLTNSVGDVITNAILGKLTPNKFIYKTDAGAMGMLPLASLPEDLQEKFGYDPQTAQAADEAEQAKKVRQQQIVQQQQEIAVQQANVKVQSQSVVSDISRSIRAKAEKEWPNDYEMQKYVISQQTEDYNWVVTASSASGVPQDIFDQIKAKAASEWPDDYEMQKYVINQQVKAYTDLH